MAEHIDAHAHLADPRVSESELAAWMSEARAQGITRWVLGGVSPEDWERQKELRKKYPEAFAMSFGLHPWWVAERDDRECDEALMLLEAELESRWRAGGGEGLVALGETGLDFHERFSEETYPRQERIFVRQIRIARRLGLPLVLHVVQGHERALQLLELESHGEMMRGIIHSFSGSLPIARRYLALGIVPSISAAVITRESGKAFEMLSRTVLSLGPNEFVLETDSPDQPPSDQKGQKNRPISLRRVASRVAELRGDREEMVLEQSTARIKTIFGLEP